ncbi:unnamed protein product [Closterium sp. NIES-65]|nr:unnamed protein product [Closterium sp. NIES-65]CAI5954588.1 unnamed protein product [Closterium sp. NIES-65]
MLIGQQHGRFPAPLLLTAFHFAQQALMASALLHSAFPSALPPLPLSSRDYCLRVIPTAVATAVDIALSNQSLAYITLTFYTMVRACLSLPACPSLLRVALSSEAFRFDAFYSFLKEVQSCQMASLYCKGRARVFLLLCLCFRSTHNVLHVSPCCTALPMPCPHATLCHAHATGGRLEPISFRLIGVMMVISVGVLFTVAGEASFHLWGFVLVMLSAMASGLRWVLIQVLLQVSPPSRLPERSPWYALYPQTPPALYLRYASFPYFSTALPSYFPASVSPVHGPVCCVLHGPPTRLLYSHHALHLTLPTPSPSFAGLSSPLVSLAYITPPMAVTCGLFSLALEPLASLPSSSYFSPPSHLAPTMLLLLLGGVLAFLMVNLRQFAAAARLRPLCSLIPAAAALHALQIMSEFLLILHTSAVTFSVAGTVKEGATILLSHQAPALLHAYFQLRPSPLHHQVSHLVFSDRFTRVNLVSVLIIMVGVSLSRPTTCNPPRSPPSPSYAQVSHLVFSDRFTRVNLVGVLIIMVGVSLFNLHR